MTKILVTPEEVRGVAADFKGASDESNAMVQKLSGKIHNLHQNWAGMSSQKFFTDFETWQKQMQGFVGMLDDINKQMLMIAERFERADAPS